MQAVDISSHEGLSSQDQEVHQSLEILRKEDNNDVWQICISFEGVMNMPSILENRTIEEFEEDFPVFVQGIEARETEGQ